MLVYALKIIYENIVIQRLAAAFITFPLFACSLVIYPSTLVLLHYNLLFAVFIYKHAGEETLFIENNRRSTAKKNPFKIDAT